MDSLLQGLPGISVYLDDILVTGSTLEEHLQNLDMVLDKLQSAGLRLNRDKCSFLQSSLEYLSHVIDGERLTFNSRKGSSHKGCPQTNESHGIAFISWIAKLLVFMGERRGGNGGVGRDSGDGMGMGCAVCQLDINPGASGTQSTTSDELDVCRSTENSTTSNSMSPRKERVVSARRVCGTLSICTSGVIQKTIRQFCGISSVKVKRKAMQGNAKW